MYILYTFIIRKKIRYFISEENYLIKNRILIRLFVTRKI